jgi:putative two-component system response regulator
MDGETALKAVEQGPLPDLILLDIMMPGIDGYEVCRRLQDNPQTCGIAIIFLSALTDTAQQEKGLSFGAVDFISKPIDPALVRARVKTQLELKSYRDGLEQKVAERTEELAHAQEAMIASMAIMAEYRDPETGNHILRTKEYIRLLAGDLATKFPLHLSAADQELLAQAAPLHDIGKVAIPDAILLKPGRLSSEEFTIMEQHTLHGSAAIRRTASIYGHNPLLQMAAEIAEFHHEKWDGSGYPHGRKGQDIPLTARLMTVADVYDALTSERPYKKAFSHEKSVAIILDGNGQTHPEHFDPQVLACFRRLHPKFQQISERFSD